VFQATLDGELSRRGMHLAEMIRQNEVGRIPQDAITAAVEKSLEITFASSPAWGSAAWHFVKMVNKLPGATFQFPFPRFMFNALRFQYEWSPLGLLGSLGSQGLRGLQQGERPAIQRLSRGVIGTGLFLTAFALRMSQDDDTLWYQIKTPDGGTVDIRPFNPFASHVFIADVLWRLGRGMDPRVDWKGIAQVIVGANFRGGFGLYTLDQMIRGLEDVQEWDKFVKAAKRGGAAIVSGLLVPLQQIKDLLAQFMDEIAVLRDRDLEPFLGPIKEKIPLLAEGWFGEAMEPAWRPTRAEPYRRELPLLRQATGLIYRGPKNAAESEIDRLGFRGPDILPRTGDDRADGIIARHMGALVEQRVVPRVEHPRYQAMEDREKAFRLDEWLDEARAAAITRAKREAPDVFRGLKELRMPRRTRAFRALRREQREGVTP